LINGKGYIGTGDCIGAEDDLWEYDPSTNTWTQKADFSGTARWRSVGFSIDDKGYVGTGLDANGRTKDFWEYNPSINTWTQKADFSGTARSQAVGFSINDKGYIGTGSFCTADFREVEIPSPTTSYQTSNPLIGTILNSTINDIDNDTKIQVEESNDEDIIRFDVEGREAVNMDNDFPINVIATPSNRHLLRLFTTADTAAWHLRLQGISNKDLGFIETSVADNRFVLAAGGNVGIGTANPNTALEVNGTVTATSFSGDGSNLTNVSGDNLGNHTATTDLNLSNHNISNANTITATSFSGDGSNLTNLSASSLQDADNDTKIQVEEGADEDVIRFDISGNELLSMKKGANSDVLIETVNKNTFLGRRAGMDNSSGLDNTFVGFDAGHSGALNTMIGSLAGAKNQGNFNVMIGQNAGGDNVNGSNNVFIGPLAGFHETGSNKLYIDILGSSTPLIYGEFDNDILKFNGNTEIQGSSGFPLIINSSVDGHVLRFKNADDTGWHMRL